MPSDNAVPPDTRIGLLFSCLGLTESSHSGIKANKILLDQIQVSPVFIKYIVNDGKKAKVIKNVKAMEKNQNKVRLAFLIHGNIYCMQELKLQSYSARSEIKKFHLLC